MDSFPDNVKRFIAAKIDSVCQLEMLLTLRRDINKAWSPSAMSSELYIAPEAAASQLEILRARGLAAATDSPKPEFQYQVATTEEDRTIQDLANLYRDRRVAVVTLIYSAPVDPLQAFADAFRIRKDE